jgi:hypothetical protein
MKVSPWPLLSGKTLEDHREDKSTDEGAGNRNLRPLASRGGTGAGGPELDRGRL